jgi:tetratricopeptide (TPR) repeat protein
LKEKVMRPSFPLTACLLSMAALGVPPASAEPVRELKGRLVTLGKDDRDQKPLKAVIVTVQETQDNDTTNDHGLFTIKLSKELKAGQTVTLTHDKKDCNKKDFVVIHPDFYGRVRVPAVGEVVEVWAVEQGSRFILMDRRLERFVERVADEAATRARQPGMPPALDWNVEVARLAREGGFREEEVLGRIREWARKAKEDRTDYRRMGLAAFAEKNFGLARENFREAARRNKREAARDLVSAGECAYAGGEYAKAIGDYSEAAKLLDPVRDRSLLREVWIKRAVAQTAFGEIGEPERAVRWLREAIQMYRDLLSALDQKTEKENWAIVQNNLGYALGVLGERSAGAEGVKYLQDSAAACREALEVCTQEHSPQLWAMTQLNLASALGALAALSSGAEGVKYLQDSAAACREALEVCTQEHSPQLWAKARLGLGNALGMLGERSAGAEGVKYLQDSAAACREALKVCTREHSPQDWARIQGVLGNALGALAALSAGAEGVKYLQDSAAAGREALKVWNREHSPQDWARIQGTLGNALGMLGALSSGAEGVKYLQDSAAAYREALKVWNREHSPQDWAKAQLNLAAALGMLGERSSGAEGVKYLQDSAAACREALEVCTREHSPQDWARIQDTLGNALRVLGERSAGETRRNHFAEAAKCYSRVLTVFSRESDAPIGQKASRELYKVEVALYLEGGEWEKAAEAGRKLAELDRHPASQARSVTAGLGAGDFAGSLRRADALLASKAVRQDPDAAAELQVARMVCLAALGLKTKAAEAASALAEHVGKQPPSYRPMGPWLGLRNYIEKFADKNVAASRNWLLGCLDAVRKERRDDVLKALRDIATPK